VSLEKVRAVRLVPATLVPREEVSGSGQGERLVEGLEARQAEGRTADPEVAEEATLRGRRRYSHSLPCDGLVAVEGVVVRRPVVIPGAVRMSDTSMTAMAEVSHLT